MKKPGPQNAKNQGFKRKNGKFSHSNPQEPSGNTRVSTLRNPKFPRSSMGCPGAFPGWEFLGNAGMAPLGIWEWLPWSLPELGIPWECPLRTAGMAPLGSS